MTPFTNQLTGRGLNGVQAIVWGQRPYYLRAIFKVINRMQGYFQADVQ